MASTLLGAYDGDVFLYYGDIRRSGYNEISTAFESKVEKSKKACIILITFGGDPDAAYRIARACNHHYKHYEILIPDMCKSAGALLCIGAKNLIFGDRGELGPLDIQLSKPDEMYESMSGLDIIQALNALENQVLSSFRSYLIDIRQGSRIRTSMAADIAAKLADGFVAPIAAKIDPVMLGEHQRAMQIAYDYGERLHKMSNSLKPGALVKLVSSYPSHGFVIDRKEAASLFNNIQQPDPNTLPLYDWAREILSRCPYPKTPIVMDVKAAVAGENNADEEVQSDKSSTASHQGISREDSDSNGAAEQTGQGDESDASQSDNPRGRSRRQTKEESRQEPD